MTETRTWVRCHTPAPSSKAMRAMASSATVTFSTIVRTVAHEARRMGLVVPVFRSPPGLSDADRTICRRHDALVVAVRVRGRPFGDIVADVVEGILVTNRIPRGRDRKVVSFFPVTYPTRYPRRRAVRSGPAVSSRPFAARRRRLISFPERRPIT